MIVLKDLINVLNENDLIKIKLKNADLIQQQVKDLKLNQYPRLEIQEVIHIDTDKRFMDDEAVNFILVTLNYELSFGDPR